MKVTTKETNTFKPFTIEVTIESIEELKELHNRLNLSSNTINDELGNDWCKDTADHMFNFIDDNLSERGIHYEI